MITSLRLAVAGLLRAPGRSAIRALVLTASVALLGGMLLFVGNSLRTVAGSSVRSVPVDLQGPVASYDQARQVAAGVARQPGVLQASATATAPLTGADHQGPAGSTSAGAGAVLAVPGDYATHIHTFRFLQGSLAPGAVVLDQQMAATLQAHLGDTVSLRTSSAARPQRYRVSGVALVTAPDQLFQPLNPQLGPAPAQPPANVVIMGLATFASTLGRALAGRERGQPRRQHPARCADRGAVAGADPARSCGPERRQPERRPRRPPRRATASSAACRARCSSSTTSRTR